MRETLSAARRKPRHKALVALRVMNEKLLDRRVMAGRTDKMEGVTELNPGAALLGRMRTRQVVRARAKVRPSLKGA